MEKLTLGSDLSNITAVESFVEEVSERYHLNDTYFGPILISLTEAFNNAVIHGNKSNKDKKVDIILDPVKSGLSFSVIDEGTGFDHSDIPDPVKSNDTNTENIGRGLYLINLLANECSFNEKGNTIEMVFNIDGIGQKIMNERFKVFNKYYHKEKHKA